MARVCRTLYRAGTRQLVAIGVTIEATETLISFCRFMLAHTAHFKYLRRLVLSLEDNFSDDPDVATMLVDVFQQATHLKHLEVNDSRFLDLHPNIITAICDLATLKTLSLQMLSMDSDGLLHDMLMRLQSPIQKLDVDFWYGSDDNDIPPGNIIQICEGLAPHLEELRVNTAQLSGFRGPVYPCVRKLSAEEGCLIDSGALIHSFPNLTELYVPSTTEPEIKERRKFNADSQRHHQWHHLSWLGGDLTSLYQLALRCPVTTLALGGLYSGRREQYLMLQEILVDSTPTNVELCISNDFKDSKKLPPLAEHIRSLAIVHWDHETEASGLDSHKITKFVSVSSSCSLDIMVMDRLLLTCCAVTDVDCPWACEEPDKVPALKHRYRLS